MVDQNWQISKKKKKVVLSVVLKIIDIKSMQETSVEGIFECISMIRIAFTV